MYWSTPHKESRRLTQRLRLLGTRAVGVGVQAKRGQNSHFWMETSLVPPKRKRRIVHFHESGHAIMDESVERADPVHKISIIPRGIAALGSTRPPHRPSPPEPRLWRDVSLDMIPSRQTGYFNLNLPRSGA